MIFILPAWNGQMMQMSYQQVLNRHQDNLDLLFIDGTTGTSK
jgi:hypothetical protein